MQSRIDFRNYLLIFLAIAIFTTPLGVLSIKGWAGYHLFICAFFHLYYFGWAEVPQSIQNLLTKHMSALHF